MSEKPEPSNGESPAGGSVFGNLPDARPGTRSPRRTTGAKPKSRSTPAAKAAAKPKPPKPAAKPRSAAPPAPPAPKTAEPRRPAVQDQQPGGLADVAWAGIAVAAEAATIGVRLASRAIEAVRGNPERD